MSVLIAVDQQDITTLVQIIVGVVMTGGTVKAGLWIKKLVGLLNLSDRVQDLEKRLTEHEKTDEINAMVAVGFLQHGETAVMIQIGKASSLDEISHLGETLVASDALCKMMFISPQEAIAGAWKEAIHPDDQTRILNEWDRFIKGNRETLKLIFSLRVMRDNQVVENEKRLVVMEMVRKRIAVGGVERIVSIFKDAHPPPETKEHLALPPPIVVKEQKI